MAKTITLHDIKPITFCIKTDGERVTLECRFQYLDAEGKVVEEAADGWVRGSMPEKWRKRVQQFMAQMVIPFIREEKGL